MEWFTQQVIDICRSDKRLTSAETVLKRSLENSISQAVQVSKSFKGLEAWTEIPVSAILRVMEADEYIMDKAEATLKLAGRIPNRGLEALAMEMNYFVQDLYQRRIYAEYSREMHLEENWYCLPTEMPDDD